MDLESATERLYTDESLAADVDDRTAKPLLKWAEAMLPSLLARGEEQFEVDFVTFKKLIKSIARLIDLRGELDVSERAERVERIQSFAQALDLKVDVDNLDAMAQFDGPSMVAQMVGPVETSTPPLAPTLETDTSRPAIPPSSATMPAPPDESRVDEHLHGEISADVNPVDGIGAFFQRLLRRTDAEHDDPTDSDQKE